MNDIMTSVRLPAELSKKLDRATHTLHQGKNKIIKQALEEFLSKLDYGNFAKEARLQSILASKTPKTDDDSSWEDNTDVSGWK